MSFQLTSIAPMTEPVAKFIQDFHSGPHESQHHYKSFLPEYINLEWTLSDPSQLILLDEANRLLGELNAFSQLIPDVDFFIRMRVT